MKRHSARTTALLAALGLCGIGSTAAQTPIPLPEGNTSFVCPDSGFLSQAKMLTDFCWNCFFPMVLSSFPTPGPRGDGRVPDGRAGVPCVCPGRTGLPAIGFPFGLWYPTHVLEITRQPWCSPVMMGQTFTGGVGKTISSMKLMGKSSAVAGSEPHEAPISAFYNFHQWTFPANEVMEMFNDFMCSPGGNDVDDVSAMLFTEMDPTWSIELLGLYLTHPESKLFAHPKARIACIADAVMSTTSKPMEAAIHCAGAWGMLYPYSGHDSQRSSVEAQMLAATRGLALLHRRGLAKRTYGNGAVCRAHSWLNYPKQQYQLQNFWPYPQRRNNNWTGASSIRWGEHRKIPVRGEDRVIVQWTYKECCVIAW